MKTAKNTLYGLALAMAAVAVIGCSGGNSDNSVKNQAAPSGRLTQGPVGGAIVWADNVDKGVRFAIDKEEEAYSTTTDPITGVFVLPKAPPYNYVLVSQGGIDQITKQPAIQMIAPAGAANITPLTTLVALDTTKTVQLKLEALMPAGVKFDTDISVSASPAALMVSKSVETIVSAMTTAVNNDSKVGGVSTISAAQISAIQAQTMQTITQEFAKPAVTATTMAVPQNLTTTLQTATTSAVTSINDNGGNITIPAATATTIASSAVSASTTALSIPASGAATTAANETAILTPAVVATLNTATAAIATTAEATVVASATLPTYVAPPIQVVTIIAPPPPGTQSIGNISFNPAVLDIGGNTTVSATSNFTPNSGLPVVFTSGSPSVCTVSGTKTVIGLTDGMCIIVANQAGNSSFTAASQVESYITIRANQTINPIVISPTTLTVGGSATVSTAATSGLAVTFNSSTPAVCRVNGSTGTVTALAAGTCTITADQIGSANYVSALQVTKNITVGKNNQAISITAMPPAGAIAGDTFTVAATAPGGAVSYSSGSLSVCTNSGSPTFSMITSGDCVVQYDQGGNGVYNAAPRLSITTSVIKQPQTMTFVVLSQLEMGNTYSLTAGTSSGLPVTFSTTSPTCTVSGSTVTPVVPGTCDIVADQPGNSRFNAAASETRTITVVKKPQTITVATTAPASAVVGSSFTVGAYASSGLPMVYVSGSTAVCTNNGSTTFTMNTAGVCRVMYLQNGDSTYAPANSVLNDTISTKSDQTVSPISYTGGATTTTLFASASSGLPVMFSSLTPTVCTVSGNTASAKSSGICTIGASQAGNTTYNAANVRFLDILMTVIPPTTGGSGTVIF